MAKLVRKIAKWEERLAKLVPAGDWRPALDHSFQWLGILLVAHHTTHSFLIVIFRKGRNMSVCSTARLGRSVMSWTDNTRHPCKISFFFFFLCTIPSLQCDHQDIEGTGCEQRYVLLPNGDFSLCAPVTWSFLNYNSHVKFQLWLYWYCLCIIKYLQMCLCFFMLSKIY